MSMEFLAEVNTVPLECLPPEGWQVINHEIYGSTNRKAYRKDHMILTVLEHVALAGKCFRKERFPGISYHCAMAFSWSCAIANELSINIAHQLIRRFPNVCPYCGCAPCLGKECKKGNARRKAIEHDQARRPHSLKAYQEMFARIYPYDRGNISDAFTHATEEGWEIARGFMNYENTHNPKYEEDAVEELTDVVTTIFAIANGAEINLAYELARWFRSGCPACCSKPCTCGFVVTTNGIPSGFEPDFEERRLVRHVSAVSVPAASLASRSNG